MECGSRFFRSTQGIPAGRPAPAREMTGCRRSPDACLCQVCRSRFAAVSTTRADQDIWGNPILISSPCILHLGILHQVPSRLQVQWWCRHRMTRCTTLHLRGPGAARPSITTIIRPQVTQIGKTPTHHSIRTKKIPYQPPETLARATAESSTRTCHETTEAQHHRRLNDTCNGNRVASGVWNCGRKWSLSQGP